MNCKGSFFLLSFSVCLLALGIDYRTMPLKDKLTHPNLTFCVTFDKFTARADKAKGIPDSTTLSTLNLGLRGKVGFDKQQAYQPIVDEELFYSVPNNILTKSGTVTLWLNAPNYNPGTKKTNGKGRGNIAIFKFLAKNKNSSLDFTLYEYADGVHFYIQPKGLGIKHGRSVSAKRKLIKKNQWHQVAITWNTKEINIYLNGKFCEKRNIPITIAKVMKNFKIDPKLSYFGIPLKVWNQKRKYPLNVDDIKVYSKALSGLEIKRQYYELALNSKLQKIDPFELKINGVLDAIDTIEVDMDLAALPKKYANILKQGKLKISYTLTGPDSFLKSGSWDCTDIKELKRISGIVKPGTYKLICTIQEDNKKSNTVSSQIYRPDLSFIGNKIGYSKKVPAPWTPLIMKGRVVSVWNRIYKFGKGPFPKSITLAGKNLLLKAPKLKISLPSGSSKITYSVGKASFTEREATLTGRGIFDKYHFDYTTSVTYDGMIKTNFIMQGSPKISSMTLEWQVNPDSAQYLMTPYLNEDKNDQFSAPYPIRPWNNPTMLWFTSEKNGGFAYAMENDANWSYKKDYPVLMANKKTGKCKITMISKKVKLPKGTDYQALFIATPTRPLVSFRRNLHLGPENIKDIYPDGRPLLFCGGRGLKEGIGSFKPLPGLFEKEIKPFKAVGIYGMVDSLLATNPVAKFFAKYYNIPNTFEYNMCDNVYNPKTKKYDFKKTVTISTCNATNINDYFLQNIKEIMTGSCADKVWMFFYDLAEDKFCGNELHGCAFTDKLGRKIKTLIFMKKRNLFERLIQLAHDNNKVVCLHAQRYFNPFMHGLADYWHPGEQNNGLTAKNENAYTDDIPDVIWRSEYNSNVLGVSVIFLPAALGIANKERPAEAMISQLLINDIEFSVSSTSPPVISRVWSILEKSGVDSNTPFHRYYEQKKALSSNPLVRVSYYKLPKNKYLFILANKTPCDGETEIDISRLSIPNGSIMFEEYKEDEVPVKNGKIKVTVPAQSFRIIAYPFSKKAYPYVNNCNKLLYASRSDNADVRFWRDPTSGHGDNTSCRLFVRKKNKSGACASYMLTVPATSGKTYTFSVWSKGTGLKKNSKVKLIIIGQDNERVIGKIASSEKPLGLEWQKYVLSVTVPTVTPWNKITKFLFKLSFKNLNGGIIWFDDIEIDEGKSL